MTTLVHTATADAIDTAIVQVESSFTRGFAALQVIGNTTEVCRDGKERAKAALESLGIYIPSQRLVISMTPADVKKDGNHFDLPIAVSIALLLNDRPAVTPPGRWLFAAELGLSGELKPVRNVVAFALAAVAHELDGIVVAHDNLPDVGVLTKFDLPHLKKLRVLGFRNLRSVLGWVFDDDLGAATYPASATRVDVSACDSSPTFDDMALSPEMAHAAVVSVAGVHSILLRGSPGSGKSMFATRLPSIMPTMHAQEHLDVLRVISNYRDRIPQKLLAGHPPFRSPHHQSSAAALLGGPDQPGELSLAHGGILFLDELPEFRRDLLEALREPLETSTVHVARAKRKVTWKARTILVAACNNCPCGWFGSSKRRCNCNSTQLTAYWSRLSGPVLDRIDMHLNMPESAFDPATLLVQLAGETPINTTAILRQQVERTRAFAKARNKKFGIEFNSQLHAKTMLEVSHLTDADFARLISKHTPRGASQRALLRSLRVARTLADIDESRCIREQDLELAWKWQSEYAARERGEEAFRASMA